MTLSGDGTIVGLSAGGLPDNTIATNDIADSAITAGKIAASAVTPAKLSQPLTQGTAVASTSGTSIDFTSIPSWVKRITVMFSGVSLSGSSNLLVQIGSGSVTTSGYASGSSGASSAVSNATAGVNVTTGFVVLIAAAGNTFIGNMQIVNVSSNLWCSSHSGYANSGGACPNGGGNINLSGTLDRVRITTVNGTDTFDAGSINVMYEG
jgi:hypothetical protein